MRFIFDLDGTLLSMGYECEKEYFNSILGDKSFKFLESLPRLLDNYENDYSRYDEEMLSSYLTQNSGCNITVDVIRGWLKANEVMSDVMEDGVIETLEYLKSKGYSLVVLTNWFSDFQKDRLEKHNLIQYFDEIYTGEEYVKPHKRAYFNACGPFKLGECVVIGDTVYKDYIVPKCLGLDAILYDKNDKHPKHLDKVKRIDEIIKRY